MLGGFHECHTWTIDTHERPVGVVGVCAQDGANGHCGRGVDFSDGFAGSQEFDCPYSGRGSRVRGSVAWRVLRWHGIPAARCRLRVAVSCERAPDLGVTRTGRMLDEGVSATSRCASTSTRHQGRVHPGACARRDGTPMARGSVRAPSERRQREVPSDAGRVRVPSVGSRRVVGGDTSGRDDAPSPGPARPHRLSCCASRHLWRSLGAAALLRVHGRHEGESRRNGGRPHNAVDVSVPARQQLGPRVTT
jgi:hypothetical protein